MMSPLAEKPLPSRSDRDSPRSRERSRISVDPSVPAASTTTSAATLAVPGPTSLVDRSCRSKWMRQPPGALARWLALACVKISGPGRPASGKGVGAPLFLAPRLRPPQQSPQRLQAGCATPAGLTVAAKLTSDGAGTGAWPNATEARLSARYLRCSVALG